MFGLRVCVTRRQRHDFPVGLSKSIVNGQSRGIENCRYTVQSNAFVEREPNRCLCFFEMAFNVEGKYLPTFVEAYFRIENDDVGEKSFLAVGLQISIGKILAVINQRAVNPSFNDVRAGAADHVQQHSLKLIL